MEKETILQVIVSLFGPYYPYPKFKKYLINNKSSIIYE